MTVADVVAKAVPRSRRWFEAAQEQAQQALEAGGQEARHRHWQREMERIRRGQVTDMEKAAQAEERE